MAVMVDQLDFKYRFVQNGQVRGLRATGGQITAEGIALGETVIPYQDIVDTTHRDSRLIVVVARGTSLDEKALKYLVDGQALILHIYKQKAADLEKRIDRYASAKEAEQHKKALIVAGKEELFRAVTCPHCHATVNLSEIEKSPYIYCRFCESILDNSLSIVANGDEHGLCGECNMFDRIRGYTIFNFYFLLIVYGFSSQERYLCDACALKASNRALLQNLIFILGVPPALWVRYKAMTGRDPELKELAQANSLARDGKYEEADKIYNRLHHRYADHPGILLNQARGHIAGGDLKGGHSYLIKSVNSSRNYMPTLYLLNQIERMTK